MRGCSSEIRKRSGYLSLNLRSTLGRRYWAGLRDIEGDISWMRQEHLILREEGSGTRKEAEKQLRVAGIELAELDVIASIDNQETINCRSYTS